MVNGERPTVNSLQSCIRNVIFELFDNSLMIFG